MTINSETELHETSGDGVVEKWVRLDLDSFGDPETYDPTVEAGTTAGQKRFDSLLGASVVTVNDAVDVVYDYDNQNIRAQSQDGTAPPSNFEVVLRLQGERGP